MWLSNCGLVALFVFVRLLSPISFLGVVCVCHSSGAVVCPKDMPYGLPALQLLRLAASHPLWPFTCMCVCVYRAWSEQRRVWRLCFFCALGLKPLVADRFMGVP